MAAKIIVLRKELKAHVADKLRRDEALIWLHAILRRREMLPVVGRQLTIVFATEVEARECQRLIVEATRRSKRA